MPKPCNAWNKPSPMFAVSWSEAAIADLDAILRYLAEVNPQAALRYAENFTSTAQLNRLYAGDFPRLGSQPAFPLLLVHLAVPDDLPH